MNHSKPVNTVRRIGQLVAVVVATSLSSGCSEPADIPALSSTGGGPNNAPPSAAFSVSCTNLDCNFNASNSTDADGNIVSYSWNFGDSTNGSGVTSNRSYSADGSYTVTLTVTDDDNATSQSSQSLSVSSGNTPPVASFTSNCPDLSCTFDASTSSDSDGSIVNYSWDFGDSTTGSGVTPAVHSYSADGSYTVILTVTDDAGANSNSSQTVSVSTGGGNNPPSASFTSNCLNLDCSFDASASSDSDGSITDYAWDFGDGTVGSGVTPPVHNYSVDGTYTVVLAVTDDAGSISTSQQSFFVTSGNQSPSAAFTASCIELNCSFDASSSSDPDGDNTITSYDWNFGDSTTGTGVSPSHNYSSAGSYSVMLTVTDDAGSSSGSSQSVTVSVINGQALYTQKCSTCHGADAQGGTLAKIDIRGTTATQIRNAINTITQMNSQSSLTDAEVQAIADYLATL